MSDMFATAASWFADQLQAHAAKSITYQGGGADLSISATRGLAGRQIDPETGAVSWQDQDWIIPVSILGRTPKPGHRIIDGDETFEVVPQSAGLDAYSPDNTGTIYRIHTKRIALA